MRRTALPGHALRSEGQPYRPGIPGEEEDEWVRITSATWTADFHMISDGWTGVGLCQCGETSPVLGTNRARKAWHRDVHKPEMRRRMEAAL